jgi:antirestriction protein
MSIVRKNSPYTTKAIRSKKFSQGGNVADDLVEKITSIAEKELPGFHYEIKKYSFVGYDEIKILVAASNYEINRVPGQFPQAVSLRLSVEDMILEPQVYRGVGGQNIYLIPDKEHPKEKYLAMAAVKIPFRKPRRDERSVLNAIRKFFQDYKEALKANRSRLMYQGFVDYHKLLSGKFELGGKPMGSTGLFQRGGTIADEPSIYVADLAAYNEGKLIGEWLKLNDYSNADELMEAIDDLLKEWSEEQGVEREEWAIHDSENLPEGFAAEYMTKEDFEKYYKAKEAADDRDIPVGVVLKWAEDTGEDVENAIDAFFGVYKDGEDAAYEMFEQGLISDVSNHIMITDTDRRIIAGEEADSRLEDVSDDDLIEEAGLDNELNDLEAQRDEYDEVYDFDFDEEKEKLVEKARANLEGTISEKKLAEMNDDDLIFEANLDDELGELEEKQVKHLRYSSFDFDSQKEDLVEQAKEKLRDEYYNWVYNELSDPVRYFVKDQGTYTEEDLVKASFIMIDYESLWNELKHDFHEVEYDGELYLFNANYAKGGVLRKRKKSTFNKKVNAIAKKFVGKKVAKKYQREYGKTYDKQEAKQAARNIVGAMKRDWEEKQKKKFAKGGEVKKK